MDTILQKITMMIRKDNEKLFSDFDESSPLLHRKASEPIDIIPIIRNEFFLIAEAKKGSPSKGIIREEFDPVEIAVNYEKAGVSAVSVITEKNFFFGHPEYLRKVKERISIPVLRKDFIIHPSQIYEAYNLGADIVLLIAACLDDTSMHSMYKQIRSLGMNALIEVHNEFELERVLKFKPSIIGINNRDLKNFKVDLNTSYRLKKMIPEDVFVISESGIKNHQDILKLKEYGFAGVLVGESLLRKEDVYTAVMELRYGKN